MTKNDKNSKLNNNNEKSNGKSNELNQKIKNDKDVKSKNNNLNELSDIINYYYLDDEDINVQIILHKIMENLELYLKTIQQIIQPEEFHSLYECGSFDENEKEELFELYKKVMILHRDLFKALVLNDEKNSIELIKIVHNESLKFRDKMLIIIDKMKKCWTIEKSDKKPKSAHYFG